MHSPSQDKSYWYCSRKGIARFKGQKVETSTTPKNKEKKNERNMTAEQKLLNEPIG